MHLRLKVNLRCLTGASCVTLQSDPYVGQAAVVGVVQALTRSLDLLNKTVRNYDAIRQAQASMVEDQLLTLNSQLTEGQHCSRFDLSADVRLPFTEAGDVPLLGCDAAEEAYQVFDLDPELTEQTFAHDLGHQNYIVQVRDADSNIVDAEVDLNDYNVTIAWRN